MIVPNRCPQWSDGRRRYWCYSRSTVYFIIFCNKAFAENVRQHTITPNGLFKPKTLHRIKHEKHQPGGGGGEKRTKHARCLDTQTGTNPKGLPCRDHPPDWQGNTPTDGHTEYGETTFLFFCKTCACSMSTSCCFIHSLKLSWSSVQFPAACVSFDCLVNTVTIRKCNH